MSVAVITGFASAEVIILITAVSLNAVRLHLEHPNYFPSYLSNYSCFKMLQQTALNTAKALGQLEM